MSGSPVVHLFHYRSRAMKKKHIETIRYGDAHTSETCGTQKVVT
jgi:hypothetical protein